MTTELPFTQIDLKDQPPPWTRIVDVSVPGGEHEICQWGYPLWVSPEDVVDDGRRKWRVLRSRLELPKMGQEGPSRAVLHIEVESLPD